MNTSKLETFVEKVKDIFTPIKAFSLILIILGLVDNLSHPTNHNFPSKDFLEFIVQSLFIFCGIFGLMGNGNSRQVRSVIVGLPFVYLSILYFISFIKYNSYTVIIPMIVFFIVGLWTVWIGEYYERRNISINRSVVGRVNTQSNFKNGRKIKE